MKRLMAVLCTLIIAGCSKNYGKTVQLVNVKDSECAKVVQVMWIANKNGWGYHYDVVLKDGSIQRWAASEVAPCGVNK